MPTLTDWTCWRDPAHKEIKNHPVFGYPQCTICRAAPPYHERPHYLPADLLLDVYVVVNPNSFLSIAPGSGIVGVPDVLNFGEPRVLVYYEGWIYGARQYEHLEARGKWEAGLLHASGRMVTNYPTAAMSSLPVSDLKKIGTYNPRTHEVTIEDEEALVAWLE